MSVLRIVFLNLLFILGTFRGSHAAGRIFQSGWGEFRVAGTGGTEERPERAVDKEHTIERRANSTGSVQPGRVEFQPDYFERTYSSGWWFSSPPILDARVESTGLSSMIAARTRTHIPSYISAYAVTAPRPMVYVTIMWQPNSEKLGWVLVYNLNGQQFQQALHQHIERGYKPAQLESYWVPDQHGLYYAALFLADPASPAAAASSRVAVLFGVPADKSYCCGPNSRWLGLQAQGYTPQSLSLTEDPSTGMLYVADVWDDAQAGGSWQGGFDKTSSQLHSALSHLVPPLSPVFVRAYWSSSSRQFLYAYLAKPASPSSSASSSSPPRIKLTTEVSRSAFELLAQSLKQPPTFVATAALPSEGYRVKTAASSSSPLREDFPGSGFASSVAAGDESEGDRAAAWTREMYTVLWQVDRAETNMFEALEGIKVAAL